MPAAMWLCIRELETIGHSPGPVTNRYRRARCRAARKQAVFQVFSHPAGHPQCAVLRLFDASQFNSRSAQVSQKICSAVAVTRV
jgi:hypothetical protein